MNLKPGEVPTRPLGSLPAATSEQMREIDRITRVEFDMEALPLMENSGRMLATLVRLMLGGRGKGQRVTVLAGGGTKGGASLAALRHLRSWGFDARVVLGAIETEMTRESLAQLRLLQKAEQADPPAELRSGGLERALAASELIIDGVAGYGLHGPLSGPGASLVEATLAVKSPVLALDVPSGTQVDGTRGPLAIKAAATMMLGLPKRALTTGDSRAWAGELYLAEIGVPAFIYERLKLSPGATFNEGPLVRLRR